MLEGMWRRVGRIFAILVLIALVLVLDAFWVEPSSLRIHREEITLSRWHRELTVAAISDLHVGSPNVSLNRVRSIVETINAQHPDVVVMAGDFVIGGPGHRAGVRGGSFVAPEDTASVLRGLRAPLGVYAVLGNHDAWYDGSRVTQAFEAAGIRMLDNRAVRLDAASQPFWLGGIADLWTSNPDIAGTLAQTDPREPVILFTHNPDIFPAVPKRVSLLIAGHTHAGQVQLPFYGPLVKVSNYGYVDGLIREGERTLFITHGIGTSIVPARFGVPPEIAILKLKPR
jgi:predicted MPP superfamily phosphohydrolase